MTASPASSCIRRSRRSCANGPRVTVRGLAKVRPLYGHNYHFHIRMKCPEGMAGCKDQWTPKPKDGTGCGEELAYWMSDVPWKPKKPDPKPRSQQAEAQATAAATALDSLGPTC